MVLPSAHGTHPDGDPFAEIDAQRLSSSSLGRMEARAREEERIAEGGLPSSTSLNQPLRSKRNTPSLYSSPRMTKDLMQQNSAQSAIKTTSAITTTNNNTTTTTTPKLPSKQSTEVIMIDDSDDSQPKEEVVVKPNSSSSNSKGNGKAKEIIKPDEDIIMTEAEIPVVTPVISSGSLTPIELNTLPSKDIEMEPPTASTSAAILPSHPASESDSAQIPSVTGPVAPTRAPRQRSPSPPPKKIKRPPKTIRLEIDMGGFDVTGVPEFSISDMAIEAGYDQDSSSEEEEDDDDEDGKSGSGSGSDSGSEDEEGNKKKKEEGNEVAEGEVEGEAEAEVEGEEEGKAEKDDAMEGVEAAAPNGDPSSATAVPAVVEPPKRKRARPAVLGRFGGYDVEDPFVDDEEIGLYEPQWYHRPKQEGYHVCIGPIELISDSKNKSKISGSRYKSKFDTNGKIIPGRRKSKVETDTTNGSNGAGSSNSANKGKATIPVAGSSKAAGTKNSPIVILSDDDELPSVSSVPAFGAGAVTKSTVARKKKPEGSFSPELQVEFDMLKREIAAENWDNKGKFPPRLRPILVDVALRAIELEEYDDDFFLILPKLFPYNLFTMKKLVKRELAPVRIKRLLIEQENYFKIIKDGIEESLDSQKIEFEVLKQEWAAKKLLNDGKKKREDELKEGKEDELNTPEPGSEDAAVASTLGISNGANNVASTSTAGATAGASGTDAVKKEEEGEPEPKWKFRFTESMRMAIYHAYQLEDEMSEIITERQELEKVTKKDGPAQEKPHSQTVARKNLYAKIASFWPDGLMLTNQLSREMSLTKKRVDREKERLEKDRIAALASAQ